MTTDQNAQTIAAARQLLADLGFDRERTNERSALVLLALLQLGPGDDWSNAANPMLGTRAIMDWISEQFDVHYAPNTRETVRRFTLHQFADALLVEQNPDRPDRPVNSPKWCYQVHASALKVIRAFGTPRICDSSFRPSDCCSWTESTVRRSSRDASNSG